MRRLNEWVFLVVWDKPGTRSAPGRFYREIGEIGDVEFIQRSVYATRTPETAQRLAELAEGYGLKVVVFLGTEIGHFKAAEGRNEMNL